MDEKSFQKLDIIIVNWNTDNQLRECLRSIYRANKIESNVLLRAVIVVDNASTDSSLDNVGKIDLPLTIIRNYKNIGFAAACNLGAKNRDSDYFLFLNPDTRLFKDSLAKSIMFMQLPSNSGIGICGIRLVDEDGKTSTSAARFPTLRVVAGKILGLTKLFPSIFPAHLMTSSDLLESGLTDQVIGAFFLIRKNVFDLCGGFDERFFVYFEEVDLSLRAKQLGYLSYFLSDAKVFHKGGGSSEQVKATRLFYSLRSRVLYAQKHYSAISYFLLIVLTAVELPLRLIQSIIKRSWMDAQNILNAYCQLIDYFLRRS